MSASTAPAAHEIAAAVKSGKTTATAVLDETLARIEAGNGALNAFTAVTAARARSEAAAVDAQVAAGGDPGPLAGVPFAVKNLFDLEGEVTLAGSIINRDNPPASSDATLVSRLVAAGAVCLGALNMGEYAYDFTGENTHEGPSRNPHDLSRMSGGSSGGSGSAVGGELVPLALGSDTNGSIRVPSSFCGIFGLKPTYGRLPRTGTFPFVDSLDHLGPMARSAEDLALAFNAMLGGDDGDPVCSDAAPAPPEGKLDEASLRVRRLGGFFRGQGDAAVDDAADRIAAALGAGDPLELSDVAEARAAAFIISNIEGAALHEERLATRPGDFEPMVRDRLMAGLLLPGIHYVRAQRVRRNFAAQLATVFAETDLLVAPATPFTAPAIGQQIGTINGEEVLLRPNIGIYTQPISFIGLPVVVVPAGLIDGMPIGVQLIAAPWREDIALAAARRLERDGVAAVPAPALR
ncbi:AtzE family amidohydrolase [Acuticoccus sp. MNP-M23]|uniref:AtzE family amidohydrolase n=1 Tax=Acuticoccus sp. MNP-M23 TaxID=3072793 RepID=UPI00281618B0|nr:AtzE family amidohydrolase [Acuticoccus sp. MNP-M23]WMS44023.1 AtzE family amidohydrolase [Acuticoccus sp. MNP-M23]